MHHSIVDYFLVTAHLEMFYSVHIRLYWAFFMLVLYLSVSLLSCLQEHFHENLTVSKFSAVKWIQKKKIACL